MPNMFSIVKFCQNKACEKESYVKRKTYGNNPQISQKMRYAEYVRQFSQMKTK